MKHLSTWQSENSAATIAMRILADKRWPENSYKELAGLGIDTGYAKMPWLGSGTLSFLSHFAFNPVEGWVREIANKYGPEELIIHFHNAWLSGSYLPIKTSRAKLHIVCTFHGINDINKLRGKNWFKFIHKGMAARLPRHNAALVSVDRMNTEVAEEIFGLKKELFKVIPNGIPQKISSTCKNIEGKKVFTLGFVGSLHESKGWRFAIDAVAQLANKNCPVKLIIAGDGPDAGTVRELAGAMGETVEYMGFLENPAERIFPLFDALVLPSVSEGLPMVILEALSNGVPVLATAVGGIPDVISDGVNGFLIERNTESIVKKIAYLAGNPLEHLKMKAKALESGRRFSIESCGQAYEELYSGLGKL